jgi:hypothetical protein
MAMGIFCGGCRKFEVCTKNGASVDRFEQGMEWNEGAGRGALGVILAVIKSM